MTQPFSAGSLCSTVGDLVAWQRALVGGRVVRAHSYAAMITPESLADGKPLTYGYGLGVGTLENRRKISHGGGIHGFTSDLAYYPEDSLHVSVLANSQANTGRFGERVARAALGLPLRPTGVALAGAERARYVGTYAATSPPAQTGRMRIFEQEGSLYRQIGSQPAGRLVARGDHVFVLEENDNIRFTFTVSGDRATKLTINHPGGTIEATREP
jgi:hypothetical protein